jgi:vacuolar-type H+-ATPase subunit H
VTDFVDHMERERDHEDDLDDDLEVDLDERVARRQPGGDVEIVLRELHEMVDQARPAPLSTSVKIDRDAVLDLLEQAITRLPDDLRGARWLLKERDEFLARTQCEADEILAAARGQAERMVQRSEVLRAAEAKARRIVEQARTDAARIRNECDDYCDERLAHLEAVLEKTMAVVALGRERLRPEIDENDPRLADHDPDAEGDDGDEHDEDDDGADGTVVFFDQDKS